MTGYAELALVRGMHYLAENQAAIANNLANVDTTGYKRRVSVAAQRSGDFHSMLGDTNLRSVVYAEQSDWTSGALRRTGDRLDVAIEGEGFFRLRTPEGHELYTRNGDFQLDGAGRLTTRGGDLVLGPDNEPITVIREGVTPSDIRITQNGEITSGEDIGNVLGQIGLHNPRVEDMQAVGNGRFLASGMRPEPATGFVRQSFLERSNVESLTEMINMITVQRTFEGTSRTLTTLGRMQSSYIQSMNR